jgi:hypothetical protein
MSDEWRPIDGAAKSGELVKVRFPPIGTDPKVRELKARFVKDVGAWSVWPGGAIANDAMEWRPLHFGE